MAKSIMEYRYDRLGAAQQNAFSHGYEGAMYPWESADDGTEDTPVWALTGPFQHHISGDVAWACWKYYQVTGDKIWLSERGWPIIKSVAEFWCSRVERDAPGRYSIRNVIGANEWLENIDNNAYTNGMAITVLRYATQAAHELGLTPDADWNHVADNIPIEQFPDGTTRENATYEGEIIKQADANLLSYPMDIVKGERRIRQDLKYYEPKMAPDGPAMSVAVLATLYARLGEAEEAFRLFNKSYQPNEVPPFGVISETAGGTNPYFATGAGGMLQTVLFGFGGLEITDAGVQQVGGVLPKAWKSLTITGVGVKRETFKVE
jgi:trehalose/maltose hydrolase-like predicted phosphorylase